ncbi:uncharacterized protein LOC110038545 isoform X2 [Phalaenopsis equestris]|nr:uncharacterized protein LOC110038545 isoform X2 [Phalaenopsis equestris]
MNRIYAQSLFLGTKTVHLLRLVSSSFETLSDGNGRSFYWISKVPSRHVLRATPIRSFSACSASQDLSIKKCVPCNSKDILIMTEQTANELLIQVPDWKLINEDGIMKLQRSWKVKSFTKGLEFFQLVADIAEAEGSLSFRWSLLETNFSRMSYCYQLSMPCRMSLETESPHCGSILCFCFWVIILTFIWLAGTR